MANYIRNEHLFPTKLTKCLSTEEDSNLTDHTSLLTTMVNVVEDFGEEVSPVDNSKRIGKNRIWKDEGFGSKSMEWLMVVVLACEKVFAEVIQITGNEWKVDLFSMFAKADSIKAVPPPLFGDYTPLSDHIDLDESQMS
ncbi:hypothetical protein Tco_0991623 [Tanacetum coccineum]|uniref:Uncharacterized protein n=1 Tax=Tanacetum coccineum TaxID=301880 RepID=A0ABQ5F0V0_9ASTR